METKACTITLGTFAVMLLTIVMICDRVAKEWERRYSALEQRCEQLEQRARYYDEVMATYEFFNEHWTATMRGEF